MSNHPIPRPVSPLRRRMLEDMAMRGLREETQRDYSSLWRRHNFQGTSSGTARHKNRSVRVAALREPRASDF